MHSMLFNLFNENINPTEQKPIDYPLRSFYSKEYDKLEKQLGGLLDEDGRKLLTQLVEAKTAEDSYADIDTFIFGFRLVSLLMVEVFHDKDNLLCNRKQYMRNLIQRPYERTESLV